MRIVVGTIIGLALLCCGPAVVAEEPSDPDGDSTQRLWLPGYEVSIAVPAAWQVEPLIGVPFSQPPHPTSDFSVRLWTGAGGHEDRAWCYLFAYSRLSCADPVDLEAELDGIGSPWEVFPAASSAYVGSDVGDMATCVRHFSSDGADLFEVKCCGETLPEDGWSSIARTLQLPDQKRPDRVAASDRNLAKDVIATNDIWSDVYGGTLVFEGDGYRESAQKRIWDPRVEAFVETIGRPARSISVDERVHRGEGGADLLVVETIRARKLRAPAWPDDMVNAAIPPTAADPRDVYDAMLAFATTEWHETRVGDPVLETMPVGRYEATRATFDDGAPPEYIVARGNTALKLRAATDELARSWLDGLACHHLDAYRLATDVLIENRPDR